MTSGGRRKPAVFTIDEIEFVDVPLVEEGRTRRDRSEKGEQRAETAPGGRRREGGQPREGETAESEDTVDQIAVPAEETAAETTARRRGVNWLGLLGIGVGGLVSIAVGFSVERMIADLFETFPLLGWIALGLACLAVAGVLGLFAKEMFGVRRMAKVERIRADAAEAVAEDDRALAVETCRRLIALYEDRPETARGRRDLEAHMAEIIDGRDLVELAERELLTRTDETALRLIVASAKRVSIVTALSPRALVDIFYVLIETLGLIRRLALLYGGRPGTLGFFRVFRHAIAHLAVTGGMAAGDSLVGEVVGQSLASKLSARLGEGVVNGLMTARLGLAAMDVVRPLPFVGARRPRVGDVISELSRIAPAQKGGRGERRGRAEPGDG